MQGDPSPLVGPRTSKEDPVVQPACVKKIQAPLAGFQTKKLVIVMLLVADELDPEMNLEELPLDTESVITPVAHLVMTVTTVQRLEIVMTPACQLVAALTAGLIDHAPQEDEHQKETKRSRSQDRHRSPKRSRTRSRHRYGRTFQRRSSSSPRRGITLVSRALLRRPPTPPPARSRQSSRNDAYQPRDDRPRHSSDDQAHHGGKGRSPPKQARWGSSKGKGDFGRRSSKGKKSGGKGKTGKQKGKGFGKHFSKTKPTKPTVLPYGAFTWRSGCFLVHRSKESNRCSILSAQQQDHSR